MGILFVLIFWVIAGSIGAAAAAFGLQTLTAAMTRHEENGPRAGTRQRVIRFTKLLPFACLACVAIVFVFQGYVNATFLHRDIGLGDASYCPFPNGYSLLMIDVGDQGTVYNPKTQLSDDSVSDQSDTISGVRELQIAGAYILGGADSQYSAHFGQNNPPMDRYFILNAQTGQHADFPSEDELRIATSKLGISLKLEPIFDVYRRYRFTWFDLVAVLLMVIPPLVAAGLLLWSIMRLRGGRTTLASSHS
jgi:hypothetical protein